MILKKKFSFCLVLLGLGLCNELLAQSAFKPEWAFGASGGVNFSSVSFVPRIYQNQLMGYHGGITARWNTDKNLGLQAEINLKQQGWDENFNKTDPTPNDFRYIRRMNYLELPLFTHIYFGGKTANFFINLGPQIGILLNEETTSFLTDRNSENEKKSPQHNTPVKKKIEWGLGGGPGIEIRTKAGYFLLEGRYYYAFSDFYSTRKGDDFSKASTQLISGKITYLIPFGGK